MEAEFDVSCERMGGGEGGWYCYNVLPHLVKVGGCGA